MILKNTSGLHLRTGPVTVFEGGGYGGDARVDDLPAGQKRILTYAVDLKRSVDVTTESDTQVVTGKIAKGVMTIRRQTRDTRGYAIDNKSDTARTLLIESPRRAGWKLKTPAKPYEKTPGVYRFKVAAAAGQITDFTVVQERTYGERIALVQMDGPRLIAFARNGAFSEAVKAALRKAGGLWSKIENSRRAIAKREKKIKTLNAEQERVRKNLRTVAANSQFHQRMMTKLGTLESEIEKQRREIETLRGRQTREQKDLNTYLAALNVA